jgi:sterol desaturase/sphingolipid hydroxylase (fatty acid hydroxylase superfamily)
MSASTFYVRHLLVPTTLPVCAAALALLPGRLTPSLGAWDQTVSLIVALAIGGVWIGLWESRCPAVGVRALRTPAQRRGDILYTIEVSLSLPLWVQGLVWLGAQRRDGVLGLSAFGWPVALQALFVFATSETLVFFIHWASHRSGIRWLWWLHVVHHRPRGLSLLSGVRVRPLELAYQMLSLAPAALLGPSPAAIVWCLAYQLLSGAVQHADLDIRLGLFNWIFPGPEVHRIHHHIDPEEAEAFALNAPLLDLVFRTTGPHLPPGVVPMGVRDETDRET